MGGRGVLELKDVLSTYYLFPLSSFFFCLIIATFQQSILASFGDMFGWIGVGRRIWILWILVPGGHVHTF
jgi:hypothetical protein